MKRITKEMGRKVERKDTDKKILLSTTFSNFRITFLYEDLNQILFLSSNFCYLK